MKRKRPRLPDGVTLKDASKIFEKTIVAICRERGLHRSFTPVEIDRVVVAMVSEFAGTLEEFSVYLEREDWDGLAQLAARERTRRMLMGVA